MLILLLTQWLRRLGLNPYYVEGLYWLPYYSPVHWFAAQWDLEWIVLKSTCGDPPDRREGIEPLITTMPTTPWLATHYRPHEVILLHATNTAMSCYLRGRQINDVIRWHNAIISWIRGLLFNCLNVTILNIFAWWWWWALYCFIHSHCMGQGNHSPRMKNMQSEIVSRSSNKQRMKKWYQCNA